MPLDAEAGKRSLRLALDRFLREVERRALRVAELSCGSRDDALELVQEAMFGFVRGYSGKPAEEWPLLFWRVLDSRLTDPYSMSQSSSSGGGIPGLSADRARGKSDAQTTAAYVEDNIYLETSATLLSDAGLHGSGALV